MKFALTATDAINRLKSNDPTLVTVDLSKNAVLQMKAPELMPMLGAALAVNTVCTELCLSGCGLGDDSVEHIAKALSANNTLATLNLEDNRVNNDGAQSIVSAAAVGPRWWAVREPER